jgi:hypothetical protein
MLLSRRVLPPAVQLVLRQELLDGGHDQLQQVTIRAEKLSDIILSQNYVWAKILQKIIGQKFV